jgi:uncharacterized protein YyaL (SSP411 family)
MAITWRQHIKNTMATMGKKTHLKDVLKAASKTWKSVKKDVSGAAPAATKSRRGRKGSRKNKKTRRSTRRSRRGGAVVAYSADQLQGGLKGAMVTGSN